MEQTQNFNIEILSQEVLPDRHAFFNVLDISLDDGTANKK